MGFDVFDRERVAAGSAEDVGPVVRVDGRGRLLFAGDVRSYLARWEGRPGGQVVLLFDPVARAAGIESASDAYPEAARWRIDAMRSTRWPHGVYAPEFVDHHRIGVGEYRAELPIGVGPRRVVFAVGEPRRLPVGAPGSVTPYV